MAKKEKLYTLTEVSKRAGVSMPTLQRYKKQFGDRIPSVGEGRRQRYPKGAIAAVRKLKAENMKKKGRPRKKAASAKKSQSAKRGKSARSAAKGLLTLSEIGRRTGISYPTLVRYVKLYIDQIPHVGEGRKRRFPVAAVKVLAKLRKTSKRGRPKKAARGKAPVQTRVGAVSDAALRRRIQELERSHKEISRQLTSVIELLKRPVQVTIRPE